MTFANDLGAVYLGDQRCHFRVWAPLAARVSVRLLSPKERLLSMQRDARGYHHATAEGVEPGSLYLYRLDGEKERPDPASRFQPQGVHGPSQIVDASFAWTDGGWTGHPLQRYVIYELHIGAFTAEGTFEAIIPHLDDLRALGITAVELMPVAQFPGDRNWGYDGVYPFAVHNSYGGPWALKRLVNACHERGLSVILDVVYNHLGPEGNYLADFGPYFTDRYKTPWGEAINFDGPESDDVRHFFIVNALTWLSEFHIDGLRLDAVHAILDHSPRRFLEDLATAVTQRSQRLHRPHYLIAESAANDARLTRAPQLGGYGLDAQWSDDFHHAVHVLLTGERSGYYQDFAGLQDLAKALREGYAYTGQYSPFRRRRHGSPCKDIPAERFVVFAQNHDQVGNRLRGERLSQLAPFESLKLAAATVILSPFVPLLFMGEEYGERAPFPYFVSHSDPKLVEATRRGRLEEFATFQWQGETADPQSESTFQSAKLNHALRTEGHHRTLLVLHRELLRLRREIPALAQLSKETLEVTAREDENILVVRRWSRESEVLAVFSYAAAPVATRWTLCAGRWVKLLDSADEKWQGGGSLIPAEIDCNGDITLPLAPKAFVLLSRTEEK
ncbi:MAG: malto-oligosyltrehalose trehalohydrolase [Deltaproteobacteria bacterium]|nr:malto-oligosyltrehalose trehalohydrolase [Deltaproteobacteria bacterium]